MLWQTKCLHPHLVLLSYWSSLGWPPYICRWTFSYLRWMYSTNLTSQALTCLYHLDLRSCICIAVHIQCMFCHCLYACRKTCMFSAHYRHSVVSLAYKIGYVLQSISLETVHDLDHIMMNHLFQTLKDFFLWDYLIFRTCPKYIDPYHAGKMPTCQISLFQYKWGLFPVWSAGGISHITCIVTRHCSPSCLATMLVQVQSLAGHLQMLD